MAGERSEARGVARIEPGDEAPAAMISGRAQGGRANAVLPAGDEPRPLTSQPEPRCQCTRYETPCSSAITQEDLLCNACRAGCTLLAFGEPGGSEFPDPAAGQHVLVTDFAFTFATPVRPGALWPLAGRNVTVAMPLSSQNRKALFP